MPDNEENSKIEIGENEGENLAYIMGGLTDIFKDLSNYDDVDPEEVNRLKEEMQLMEKKTNELISLMETLQDPEQKELIREQVKSKIEEISGLKARVMKIHEDQKSMFNKKKLGKAAKTLFLKIIPNAIMLAQAKKKSKEK